MSNRPPRAHATRRAAPIVLATSLGVLAGAGTTVLASSPAGVDPRAAKRDTTADMRVTRGGKTWMSAQATFVGRDVWATRVRAPRYITPGTYRIRLKFSSPAGDNVVRYNARLTEVR